MASSRAIHELFGEKSRDRTLTGIDVLTEEVAAVHGAAVLHPAGLSKAMSLPSDRDVKLVKLDHLLETKGGGGP